MLHRQLPIDFPALPPSDDSFLLRLTPCDPTALHQLRRAFADLRPAAILIGDGRIRSNQVIDNFLADVEEETCIARIPTPCDDPTTCMRAVVTAIGFEPKDFCLADLENIFKMFLGHQKTHGRRTILCFENAQDCDTWVLNKVFELTELEAEARFGLFIILSGQCKMRDLLYQHPLEDMVALTGRHIAVSPLALAETRKLVLQQIRSEGTEDVSEIIDFEAITALHEIGAGIPDTVSGLCSKSLQLAAEASDYPITSLAINRAACTLGLVPESASNAVSPQAHNDVFERNFDRLIISMPDRTFVERKLDNDCVSIGRDRSNDLCIPSATISRHHGLIVTSAKGVELVDLGSTNGSFVNEEKISSQILTSGDNIRLGDCQIGYVAAERRPSPLAVVEDMGLVRSRLQGVELLSEKFAEQHFE